MRTKLSKKSIIYRRRNKIAIENNRARAKAVGVWFCLYLAFMMCCTSLICVHYIHQKTFIKFQENENRQLEEKLLTLRGENDAMMQNLYNSVSIHELYKKAQEYQLKLPKREQIIYYKENDKSYVIQYKDVS